MISSWSHLIWARSHLMWVEGTHLVAVNVSRKWRCSQAEPFMISSRYIYPAPQRVRGVPDYSGTIAELSFIKPTFIQRPEVL